MYDYLLEIVRLYTPKEDGRFVQCPMNPAVQTLIEEGLLEHHSTAVDDGRLFIFVRPTFKGFVEAYKRVTKKNRQNLDALHQYMKLN